MEALNRIPFGAGPVVTRLRRNQYGIGAPSEGFGFHEAFSRVWDHAYFLTTGPLGSGVCVPRLGAQSRGRYRSTCTCGTGTQVLLCCCAGAG